MGHSLKMHGKIAPREKAQQIIERPFKETSQELQVASSGSVM